jgi:CBS domain-containing protein
MTTQAVATPPGSIFEPPPQAYFAPSFEGATVGDAMRLGVVSCSADTPLREAARLMASYRIHCVVVFDLDEEEPWGVVSDLDLAASAGHVDGRTVRDVASTELVTLSVDESLVRAAQLMTEHEVAHLIVVQPRSGHPVGVISTLDLAGVLAWGGAA